MRLWLGQVFSNAFIFPMGAVAKALEPDKVRPTDDHTRTGLNAAVDMEGLRYSLMAHKEVAWWLRLNHVMRVSDVDVIDLHPRLLDDQWRPYGAFVLHHEFIHALGFRAHDSTFRALESAWPGRRASKHAREFTELMRRSRADWLWVCATCDTTYPRQKRSRGRYKCRVCSSVLTDRINPDKV